MKVKSILILLGISLLPLIFTSTIPFYLPRQLTLNTTLSTEHMWGFESRSYVVSLQDNNFYTIEVVVDPFWGMDVSIKVSDNPYFLSGQIVDSISYSGEVMNFPAYKNGNVYILLETRSGSGFFEMTVNEGITSTETGSITAFNNFGYLLILILPSSIIFLLGMVIVSKRGKRETIPRVNIYARKPKQEEAVEKVEEIGKFCQYCGSKLEQSSQICPNCGSPQD